MEPLLSPLGFTVLITGGTTHQNLIAKNKAARTCDKTEQRYFALCGHVDTVPADTVLWDTDPWQLTEMDEKLYGLGAGDMKGPVACMMKALEQAATASPGLPAALVLTHTEENGLVGARELINTAAARNELKNMKLIIGEPTSFSLSNAHKGYHGFHIVITGKSAHSSRPHEGLNVIYAASRVSLKIAEINKTLMKKTLSPFEYGCTANVGIFQAGDILNRVPDKADLEGDFRYFGYCDADRFTAELQGLFQSLEKEGFKCSYTPILESPPFFMPAGKGMMGELEKLLDKEPGTLPYTTDASVFTGLADLPCAIIGPGSIDVCHQPNEYITTEDLNRGVELYTKILLSQE